MTFTKGQIIDNTYTVVFPLSATGGTELYRVRDLQGHLHLLKLFICTQLEENQLDPQGEVREIAIRRNLQHPNICTFTHDGTFHLQDSDYAYFTTEFVSFETLAARLKRIHTLSADEVRTIGATLLRLLRTLHSQSLTHNAITTNTIWLDLTRDLTDFRLTDFSRARHPSQDVADDIRCVGAVLYECLYGMPPTQPLRIPALAGDAPADERLLKVVAKALANDASQSFASADDMLQALQGNTDITLPLSQLNAQASSNYNHTQGHGFADVAGMEDLKKLLNENVLYVLRDKERAQRYKLTIPNGMLLYGPPGCGKTFIAERFAEEAGYNYQLVTASDLASIYIHGTQEKIGELFRQARAKAPTVLCFDEFEALVPRRTNVHNANLSGEVNEFLTQLNNCGKSGVFVIATTNQPDLIDPAVLRRGRMDLLVYVPMPDSAARRELFRIHLADRPLSDDLNLQKLADKTPNFIASEIAYVVDTAARRAALTDGPITS